MKILYQLLLVCTMAGIASFAGDTCEDLNNNQNYIVEQLYDLYISRVIKPEREAKDPFESENQAQEAAQSLKECWAEISSHFQKTITIPASNTNNTLASYPVLDLQTIEKSLLSYMEEEDKKDKAYKERVGWNKPTGAILKLFEHLCVVLNTQHSAPKNIAKEIAAQYLLFDAQDRQRLSSLLISWFSCMQAEIPALFAFLRPEKTKSGLEPLDLWSEVVYHRSFFVHLKKLRKQYQSYLTDIAPYVAAWHIGNTLFLKQETSPLFDMLPASQEIKNAYLAARNTLSTHWKQSVNKTDKIFEIASERISDLLLWELLAFMFMSEEMEETFIETQRWGKKLRAQRMFRLQGAMLYYKRKKQGLAPLSSEQEAKLRDAFLKQYPEALPEDFYQFDGAQSTEDQEALIRQISERNAWLQQNPELTIVQWCAEQALREEKQWKSEHPGKDTKLFWAGIDDPESVAHAS